jgi:hypothetical protein
MFCHGGRRYGYRDFSEQPEHFRLVADPGRAADLSVR